MIEEKNLPQWLDYWDTLHTGGKIDLDLRRTQEVWTKLKKGRTAPIITVGGTNGKGSVCAFLAAIYRAAGYRVGSFFSPHLLRFNERIAINTVSVEDETIVKAFAELDKVRGDISLTFFEAATLAAMEIFQTSAVDIIILEVGLGGRLDAVNVFDPSVAIVTNVALDHQDYLGDTREKIGREKAEIARKNVPIIVGEKNIPDSVLQTIEQKEAVPFRAGVDFHYQKQELQWDYHFTPRDKPLYKEHHRFALPLPVFLGSYQLSNAALALTAIECLNAVFPIDTASIKRGLLKVRHPGRFEILPCRPMVVLDVGHNPHAAAALRRNLLTLPFARKRLALFSVLQDKDLSGIINEIKDEFDAWYVAPLSTTRALGCDKIVAALHGAGENEVFVFPNIAKAYTAAWQAMSEEDRMVVFGSFYTVSEAIRAIESVGDE